jgi:hypothetical protein
MSGAAVQHRRERLENRAHLRRLVGKQLRRIHVVDDGGIVRLEYQQFSALVFRAVDREIVETDPIGHAGQRRLMAAREADVEGAHERLFLETLGCTVGHPRIEIPDIPTIGDRHMACVGPAIDENNAVLAKQAVLVGVIDEARDEEFLLRPFRKISSDRGAIIDFGEPDARMRTARPNDDRRPELGCNVREQKIRLSDIR